jgi:hypothetical protein
VSSTRVLHLRRSSELICSTDIDVSTKSCTHSPRLSSSIPCSRSFNYSPSTPKSACHLRQLRSSYRAKALSALPESVSVMS